VELVIVTIETWKYLNPPISVERWRWYTMSWGSYIQQIILAETWSLRGFPAQGEWNARWIANEGAGHYVALTYSPSASDSINARSRLMPYRKNTDQLEIFTSRSIQFRSSTFGTRKAPVPPSQRSILTWHVLQPKSVSRELPR